MIEETESVFQPDPNDLALSSPATDDRTLLLREQSRYQLIELYRHPVFGTQLVLDGDLQISVSDAAYNTAIVAPLIGIEPLERVVILGGGDGGVLGELLKNPVIADNPRLAVDLVDIDDRVLSLAREHFAGFSRGAFDDPRANVMCGDAFAYIKAQRNLDGVVYDLTMDPIRDDQSRQEFMRQILSDISDALRPGGVFSMQCCSGEESAIPGSPAAELLAEIGASVRARFTAVEVQAVRVPSYEEPWIFLSARKP